MRLLFFRCTWQQGNLTFSFDRKNERPRIVKRLALSVVVSEKQLVTSWPAVGKSLSIPLTANSSDSCSSNQAIFFSLNVCWKMNSLGSTRHWNAFSLIWYSRRDTASILWQICQCSNLICFFRLLESSVYPVSTSKKKKKTLDHAICDYNPVWHPQIFTEKTQSLIYRATKDVSSDWFWKGNLSLSLSSPTARILDPKAPSRVFPSSPSSRLSVGIGRGLGWGL